MNFLKIIGNHLDSHMEKYDNLILIGDYNSEMEEETIKDFCEIYNLKNLIKKPTCFKSVENPTSIDLILTNKSNRFENSMAIEKGLSDHQKMIITVLKNSFYQNKTNKY